MLPLVRIEVTTFESKSKDVSRIELVIGRPVDEIFFEILFVGEEVPSKAPNDPPVVDLLEDNILFSY